MPNQEKSPRAWVYARIPGDCAATRASYDACCRQAGDNGCTVVGGSIDYKGHGPLRDGYQCMPKSLETSWAAWLIMVYIQLLTLINKSVHINAKK